MRVLVVGGAGYIGSFVAGALEKRGHGVVVLDDLSTGHRAAASGRELVVGRCGDTEPTAALMRERGIEAVVHLAALSLVGESVKNPGRYWLENAGQAAGLLQACREAGVGRFLLSSTAAVYGEPEVVPIVEDSPLQPTNPYGATKVAIERMLADFQAACGLSWVSLRYFNAAGAAPDGSRGEDHSPETHLLPLAFQALVGMRPPLTVFGEDYPTPDGTCLRDYVHVLDLADAHVRALEWMEANQRDGGSHLIANLGGGQGKSVKEILETIAKVTGREVPHSIGDRRAGDPAVLFASAARAKTELGWNPQHSDVETIVKDAWAWHEANPKGYDD